MTTYTCPCCGHTENFETAGAAHDANWDVAPYFTLQPLCDWCMFAPILIHGLDEAGRLLADEHKNWRKHGRPRPIRDITGEQPNPD